MPKIHGGGNYASKYSNFFFALRPNADYGLLLYEVSRSHTMTHHSRQDSSGRVISSSQRLDNTQQSQETNIHAPGAIRNHNLSRRAAADPPRLLAVWIYTDMKYQAVPNIVKLFFVVKLLMVSFYTRSWGITCGVLSAGWRGTCVIQTPAHRKEILQNC